MTKIVSFVSYFPFPEDSVDVEADSCVSKRNGGTSKYLSRHNIVVFKLYTVYFLNLFVRSYLELRSILQQHKFGINTVIFFLTYRNCG